MTWGIRVFNRQFVRPSNIPTSEPPVFRVFSANTNLTNSNTPTTVFNSGVNNGLAPCAFFPGVTGGYGSAAYFQHGFSLFLDTHGVPAPLTGVTRLLGSVQSAMGFSGPTFASLISFYVEIALMDAGWDKTTLTWNTMPAFSGKLFHYPQSLVTNHTYNVDPNVSLAFLIRNSPNPLAPLVIPDPCYGVASRIVGPSIGFTTFGVTTSVSLRRYQSPA